MGDEVAIIMVLQRLKSDRHNLQRNCHFWKLNKKRKFSGNVSYFLPFYLFVVKLFYQQVEFLAARGRNKRTTLRDRCGMKSFAFSPPDVRKSVRKNKDRFMLQISCLQVIFIQNETRIKSRILLYYKDLEMVFEITVFNLQVGFNPMTLSVYRNGAIDSFIERKQFYALQRTTRTRVFLLTGLLFYSNWLTSLQVNFF